MGANIREIKGRIKAVKNIQRITKTMQMIATARFQAMQKRATDAQAYTRKIAEVVGEVASSLSGGEAIHPLLQTPSTPTGKHLVLVITSDRGLCGSYNGKVLKLAEELIQTELAGQQVDLELVGKKGAAYCKFNNLEVAKQHMQFGDNPSYEDVNALAESYMEAFILGQYDSVRVLYTEFVSMSKQVPEVKTLLPLQPPKAEAGSEATNTDYEFSPEPAEMLAELLPVTVKTTLYQCFNESIVSEQLARMIAMKAATDAAGKMGKSLKRQFNRARQAAITTELSEIIGGAAALE